MQCAHSSSSGQRQELNTSTPAEGIAAFCSHSILCLHRAAVPWPNMSLRAFSSVSPVAFFYTQRRFCSSRPGSPGIGQGLVKKGRARKQSAMS